VRQSLKKREKKLTFFKNGRHCVNFQLFDKKIGISSKEFNIFSKFFTFICFKSLKAEKNYRPAGGTQRAD